MGINSGITIPNNYWKGLAVGMVVSIILGMLIGWGISNFESYYVMIPIMSVLICAYIPRIFMHRKHNVINMLICALVAFINTLTLYLTMETLYVMFEDEYFIYALMILAPLSGLYIGYINIYDHQK